MQTVQNGEYLSEIGRTSREDYTHPGTHSREDYTHRGPTTGEVHTRGPTTGRGTHPGSMAGMCTMGSMAGMCTMGGMVGREVYLPWWEERCTYYGEKRSIYTRVGMVGIPVYTPGWVWWVYTSWYICLLPYPGYTHHHTLHHGPVHPAAHGVQRDSDEALGSRGENPMGGREERGLESSKV